VIVCGHYGCGGVIASFEQRPLGLVDNWLLPIRDIARTSAAQLAELPTDAERADRLCELNVLHQARRVCRTTIVQQAWERGRSLTVHAWVYRLNDGLLRDLGFCASDLASADADFERTAAAGTIAR
jgi:carbonic anhydrase